MLPTDPPGNVGTRSSETHGDSVGESIGQPIGDKASTLDDISLTELATHTGAYARAWVGLLLSETALAKTNLLRIVLLALLVPAIALSMILCLDVLLAALVHAWLQSWLIDCSVVLITNVLGLLGIFLLLRGWWRTLTLPRTRAALRRLIEGTQ